MGVMGMPRRRRGGGRRTQVPLSLPAHGTTAAAVMVAAVASARLLPRPLPPAIWAEPSRRRHRAVTIRSTTTGGVLVGIERGRLDWSINPAGPSARNRAAHFRAVGGEVMNIFAATSTRG